MNILVKGEFASPSQEAKGLSVVKATHLKTKTNLEFKVDKDNIGSVDFYQGLLKDIRLLKLQSAPWTATVVVEGVPALGRIINRSVVAMSKVSVKITELGWEDKDGMVMVSGDLIGGDFPVVSDLIIRLCRRAMTAISGTHHPLTLFDFRQSTGITHESKIVGSASAKDIESWMNVRELSILEAEKEEKATAAAAKKEAAKLEAAKKASAKPKAPAPEKNVPKAAPKAAAKKPEPKSPKPATANLGNIQ